MNLRTLTRLALGIVLLIVLAACGADQTRTITPGADLFAVTFDQPGSWEEGRYPPKADPPDSVLAIADGRYQIDHRAGRSASFAWGLGGGSAQDVIIEVETEQLSDNHDNLYGVGCRMVADERGDATGYVLLISGDGHYGIARLQSRSLTFLLDWHESDAIHQGRARNTIRAACIGDYLAIYANGKFLGETSDSTFRRAGQIGLLAGASADHAVSIAFDNLTVSEGTAREK